MGAGDLAARIPIVGKDELSEVALEFNRMAARLEAYYADLEAQVRARTQALGQANLEVRRQADALNALNVELTARVCELALRREEADRANAAKTRFLASASHDLRQPMHTISLLVGALKEQLQGRAAARLLAKITVAIESMESLFGSLLDISKLDAGVVRANIEEVRISGLLDYLESTFAAQANEKGIALRIVKSAAVARTDAALLERILANLVANAINYTARGGVLVGCRFRGDNVEVWVCDTGVGIPQDRTQQVFDEFVQLDNPGRDRSKGLGLGLSIVKRTVDLLGHKLTVRSTVGRGSTFAVALPLIRRRPIALDPPIAAQAPVGALKGAFVVVIDDAEENRSAMVTLCEQWGCLVVSASSGKELYRLLETHLRSPDLVISDYRLNEDEIGFEVIQQVRRTAEALVPAIVITGDVSAVADTGLPRVVVLHKPLNASQFLRAALALLGSEEPRPDREG